MRLPFARTNPKLQPYDNMLKGLTKTLNRNQALLHQASKQQIMSMTQAVQAHDFSEARHRLSALQLHLDLLEIVSELRREAESETPPDLASTTLTFKLGTMSLYDWYKVLMPPEKALCVSGAVVGDGLYYLDQTMPLKPNHASSVDFQPDIESIYQALKRFDYFGYGLRALVHSHPGRGPAATHPSGRDIETQRALERHYRCLGIIFSEEGYFRLFSDQMPFSVSIFGKNMEVIDDQQHLYRLLLP